MTDKSKLPPPSTVEQRINAQLQVAQRMKTERASAVAGPAPFITISRQFGCNAVYLGDALAAKLASLAKNPAVPWQVYTRQIVENIASELPLSNRLLDALDFQARGTMEEFFETLIGQAPPDLKLLHGLVRVMRASALHGRCILIGRGGAILTRDLSGGMHIRLVASVDWRIKNLTARYGWSTAQAKDQMREEEDTRRNFFQKYLGQDASNPEHYDLILNVARMNLAEQISAVTALYAQRFSL